MDKEEYRYPVKTRDDLAWGTTITGLAAVSEVLKIAGATSIRVRAEFTKAGTLRVALLQHDRSTEITDPAPQTLAMVADTEGMIEFTGIIGETYIKITFTAGAADSDVTAIWVYHTSSGSLEVSAILEGDVAIGAVEIKDHTTDVRATVKAGTSLVAADPALAIKDPGVGFADDAKVDTDAVGTLSSKLRGAVSRLVELVTTIGATDDAKVDTDADGTVSAKLRGIAAATGGTDDAKVDTDAVGSMSSKLRGIVSKLVELVTTTGATDDAKVDTDAVGTVSSKLRGIVSLLASALASLIPSSSMVAATIVATDTAAALVAQACRSLLLQADPDNTVDAFIGDASTQPIQLAPGASVVLPVANANVVYVVTATDTARVNSIALV